MGPHAVEDEDAVLRIDRHIGDPAELPPERELRPVELGFVGISAVPENHASSQQADQ